MLVLSRRVQEAVCFPDLGTTIRILGIEGNRIKIGIEAPPDVTVLRGELDAVPSGARRRSRHSLGNGLNQLSLLLHLFRRQIEAGQVNEANASLARAFEVLDQLGQQFNQPAEPAPRPAQRRNTLVVEDDGNERELLAGLLKMSGFACDAVADGIDALEYLASHDPPDVVLLDLMMPRCDGAQTIAAIRREPRFAGLKVFAISGTSPQEMGIPTGPGGVDAWFPKPLNTNKLWDAIRALPPN